MFTYLLFLVVVFFTLEFLKHYRVFGRFCKLKIGQYKLFRVSEAFFICFLLITFFAVIRDGIGTDYYNYYNYSIEIQKDFSFKSAEIGYKVLVKIAELFSSDPRLPLHFAAIIIYYCFLTTIFEQSKNPKLAVLLYICWGAYFSSFSLIRHQLAVSLCFYSLKYVKDKRYLAFLVCVLLGASFHKSALMVLPFYYIANQNVSWKKYVLVFFSSCIACILCESYVKDLLFLFYPSYENSKYDLARVSYQNIAMGASILILGYLNKRNIKIDKMLNLLFNIGSIGFICYTCANYIPLIKRLGNFFSYSFFLFVPYVLTLMGKKGRIIKYCFIIGSIVLYYCFLIQWSRYDYSMIPFKTWLF